MALTLGATGRVLAEQIALATCGAAYIRLLEVAKGREPRGNRSPGDNRRIFG
jgi:hypothetical protein